MSEGEYRLDDQEVKRFHEQGFIGPFEVRSPEEISEVREHLWAELAASASEDDDISNVLTDRHIDCSVLCDLVTEPKIVDKIASIIGPDLVVPTTRIWPKMPDGREVPWHQDGAFFPMYPRTTVSAWIALTESTSENGCVQFIPGTHRNEFLDLVPAERSQEKIFNNEIAPEEIPDKDAVEMELDPGEFFLFTGKTIHRSLKNETESPRLGVAVRASPSFVHLYEDEAREFTGKGNEREVQVMELSGTNHNDLNTTVPQPSECTH